MGEVEGEVKESRDESAERDSRRRYILASIRQYPDPVLRQPAHEVAEFDNALAALVGRMIVVMQRASGVGLAAPQLGVLQRVLVYQADDDAEPVALVNPRIVASSEEHEMVEEGCLSLGAADVTVDVERPVRVTVEAFSTLGEELQVEAEGLEARVIQHEIDHLDGMLIIDRTVPEQRREALGKLRQPPILGRLAN
jgi:peptide deformylase